MSNLSIHSEKVLMNTYQRFPLRLVKGRGSYVWDEEGRKYLDYTSGIAACNLGHVPDSVNKKVKEQLDLLWHCSNLFEIPLQEQLAALLTENSIFDQVFFCNSGAEANEAAIKLAKKYAKDCGNPERTEIVTFYNSFHGRTGTTMAATGQEKIHRGFTPLTPGFRYLPFNDQQSLEEIHNGKTTAVLLELVQGEGGVNVAHPEWVRQLKQVCEENDILFIVDEVQTGIGRTGTLFAYEQFGVEPDIITLAKGLGSGFPVGAVLAKEKVAASFQPGTHGSTFGGNPLAMSAGMETIETILEGNILQEVKQKEKQLMADLIRLQQSYSRIKEIRGLGLLIGMELEGAASFIVEQLQKRNILVLTAGPNVVRILPPLTTTLDELALFIGQLEEILLEEVGR